MNGPEELDRLYVICEGQTEQRFCSEVLQQHLFRQGNGVIHSVAPRAKNHRHVFGIDKYLHLKKFIQNLLKQHADRHIYFTTLIDLYELPDDFPGMSDNNLKSSDPTPYVLALQSAFGSDISDRRFIPHLQLYEYETMLFADPDQFAIAFEDCGDQINRLKAITEKYSSIELINGNQNTAPSKRIRELIPAYKGRKPTAGVEIATMIGIAKIRSACPHFDQWLDRLEKIYLNVTIDEQEGSTGGNAP